ncbi:MAG TPA: hypothetical protein VG095_03295 [Chthoniobacterales bacterium]|nr:hypothetical protein [Chthoniobacterales bacterium]
MPRKFVRVALWVAAAAYVIAGGVSIGRGLGHAPDAAGLARAHFVFGSLFVAIGAVAGAVTARTKKWSASLIVAAGVLFSGVPIGFFAAFWIDMEKAEVKRRRYEAEVHSGRHAFGDQPALLAVAQAVAANNPEAILAAAKAVPDLQAAGRDGTTLLCWAVRESWQRPQLVDAVRTLLALGADPNYTNGQRESYAMAHAVHGPAPLLAAMLEAGGDPNTRDEFGRPIVLMNWYLGYYRDHQRRRLELLLDHGADINSTMPAMGSDEDGYTLLLRRAAMGLRDQAAYSDALFLLERGADPQRAGADGMTLAKMLAQHREQLGRAAPAEFTRLWEEAQRRGVVSQPQ